MLAHAAVRERQASSRRLAATSRLALPAVGVGPASGAGLPRPSSGEAAAPLASKAAWRCSSRGGPTSAAVAGAEAAGVRYLSWRCVRASSSRRAARSAAEGQTWACAERARRG
eukprot:scaffold36191_cov26-Tisochrysis_lutea.AAC.1